MKSRHIENASVFTWSAVCELWFAVRDARMKRQWNLPDSRPELMHHAHAASRIIRAWVYANNITAEDRASLIATLRGQVRMLRGEPTGWDPTDDGHIAAGEIATGTE